MAQEESQSTQKSQPQKQSIADSLPSFLFPIISAQSIAIAIIFTILGLFTYGRTFDGFLFTILFIITIGLLSSTSLIPFIGFPLYVFLLLPYSENILFTITGYSPTLFTELVSDFSLVMGGIYYLIITFAFVGVRLGLGTNVKTTS